jgi:hypothetical protein
MTERPDPPTEDSGPGRATTRWAAGHGQLTNAVACRRFVACRYTEIKESPESRGFQLPKKGETLEGPKVSLEAPILSQGANQARRGSRRE